jgi:hypothetical protein
MALMAHPITKGSIMTIGLKWTGGAGSLIAALALIAVAQAAPLKTGFYSIDHMAMGPASIGFTTASDIYPGVGLFNAASDPACFTAGVNLPHGATIQTVVVSYRSGPNTNPSAGLFRHRYPTDDNETVAEKDLTDNSGERKNTQLPLNPDRRVVDNAHFAYGFKVCLGGSNGDSFYSARITYQYAD